MFSRFFKKKPADTPETAFPYAQTERELGGTEATSRKRHLESRRQTLTTLASQVRPLTKAEQAELVQIEAEIANLLQVDSSGSFEPAPVVNTSGYEDWLTQGPAAARILLIEDDPDMNALINFMLEHNRFEVQRFNNGKLARDWILSQPAPDLISLDIMLPQIDGLELIATIRRQPGWEKVPIVMLTSKSDELTVQRALKLGANEFLVKPFQPEDYLARVKRLLAAR